MSFSKYLEHNILDHVFKGSKYDVPTLHLALFSAAPDDTGSGGTEISGGGYSRQPIDFSAASGDPTATSNPNEVIYPAATTDWDKVVGVGIYDAHTGGNMLLHVPLTDSKKVFAGDLFSVPPEGFVISLDSGAPLYAISVNSAMVKGSHTDFPAFLKPSVIDGIGSLTQAQADSLRIYADVARTQELAREVVSPDEIHVKVPTLKKDTTIYLAFDGQKPDHPDNGTFGAQNVWTNGFAAVWHMESAGVKDSTANGNDKVAGTATEVSGPVGGALSFNGTSDNIEMGASNTLEPSPDFTISCWIDWKGPATTNRYKRVVGFGAFSDAGLIGFSMVRVQKGQFYFRIGSKNEASIGKLPPDSLTHFCGVRTSSSTIAYKNGDHQETQGPGNLVYGNRLFDIGSRSSEGGGVNQHWDGLVDEVRLSSVERSAGWIKTEYNNQNDPASFWVGSA